MNLNLYGRTGSMKSTLARLILSHFDNFNNTDLPMSFRDTANSIVRKAFLLKDTLTVIDDFTNIAGFEDDEYYY